MLNKNFFKDLFRKDFSSYVYFGVGAIGLGAVVFYVGIALGLWNFDPFDLEAYWNVILGLALLVMAIVFLFVELIPLSLLFFFIFGVFVFNSGEGSILELFIDPVVFIVAIFLFFGSWVGSTSFSKKSVMMKNLHKQKKALHDYGTDESRIKEIIEQNHEDGKKNWKKQYGEEEWDIDKK